MDAETRVPAGAAHAGELGGLHVLVVEDEPSVRRHVCALLRGLGCRVGEADNGASALELLADADGFDLLMTDIVLLGDMNGFELARRARERVPGIKLLFMSGYDHAAREGMEAIPEAPMLSKPFRRAQLEGAIRGALGPGTAEKAVP